MRLYTEWTDRIHISPHVKWESAQPFEVSLINAKEVSDFLGGLYWFLADAEGTKTDWSLIGPIIGEKKKSIDLGAFFFDTNWGV